MNDQKRELIMASCRRSKMLALFDAAVSGLSDGFFEITFPKLDFMHRPTGIFNGSTIAAAVDVSAGYAAVAAQADDAVFSTVEFKINFLNPAKGDRMTAGAHVLKKGATLTVVRVDVTTSDDTKPNTRYLVATALVTLMQLKNKKKSGNQ